MIAPNHYLANTTFEVLFIAIYDHIFISIPPLTSFHWSMLN